MRVVIVGGGKVGGYLARELRGARHAVVVIERNADRARMVADEAGALAIVGDGTDVRILEEADVRRADWFLALTGRDEDNLVACQLARAAFSPRELLARLNDPDNRSTFEALNVPVVAVTDLIVKVISHEIDVGELDRLALLAAGQVSLLEVEVPDGSETRLVAEVRLPPSTVLAAVTRGAQVIVPGAGTALLPGDRVLAITLVDNEEVVLTALTGNLGRTVESP